MNHRMTIAQICGALESPLFDRKSARIDAKTLAIHLIAFANADGGMIAVGVEDDGTITGIDGHAEHINELLRAPFDFCKPSVRVETERLSCVNRDGTPDHILLIEVLQSNDLHTNQADEVFFRVGDKSKKLNFEERLQLMYAKGTRYFEDTPVPDAAMEDIDLGFVKTYTEKLGYPSTAYLFTASQVLCHYSHWNKEWLLPSHEGIPIHHITGLQPPPCSQLSTFRYAYLILVA
ncbi:MAG: ATP-binding protein [Clostridiales bacterium]|nr:ATP-binding protein [Clostridiales bacterium]